ncbi:MAG: hypothetical protein ACE5DM_01825 [Candidatus Nanoarchaeia archaeon]
MKRAQFSMEFMQQWGFALLALIAILGVLVYFGVQDVQRVVPDRCIFLNGFNCLDVLVVDSGNSTFPSTIQIIVRNEIGFDISSISIRINGTCDSSMNTTGEIAPTALLNKEDGLFGFACFNLSGVDINENIRFEFTNSATNVAHTKVGYIRLKQ